MTPTRWDILRHAVSLAERVGREPTSYEADSARLDQIARDADDALAAATPARGTETPEAWAVADREGALVANTATLNVNNATHDVAKLNGDGRGRPPFSLVPLYRSAGAPAAAVRKPWTNKDHAELVALIDRFDLPQNDISGVDAHGLARALRERYFAAAGAGGATPGFTTFPAWGAELKRLAAQMTPPFDKHIDLSDPCWLTSFDDGWTPEETLAEEFRND